MHNNPLVSVCCLAYNHEPYIVQALEGFVMQKTNFSFEVLIHDDASTDGTADIIRTYQKKYPEIIKPIYQTKNQFSKGVKVTQKFQFPRAQGKYIAMCEGDDYWTDPLKLQKQVDFLEANSDYCLTCHRFNVVDEKGKLSSDGFESYFTEGKKMLEFTNDYNLENWLLKTLSVVYRKDSFDKIDVHKYKYLRDTHLFYLILKHGKGICFNEVMGIYRKHEGGIHSSLSTLSKMFVSYQVFKDLYDRNLEDKTLGRVLDGCKRNIRNKSLFLLLRSENFGGKLNRKRLIDFIHNSDKYRIQEVILLLRGFTSSSILSLYRFIFKRNLML